MLATSATVMASAQHWTMPLISMKWSISDALLVSRASEQVRLKGQIISTPCFITRIFKSEAFKWPSDWVRYIPVCFGTQPFINMQWKTTAEVWYDIWYYIIFAILPREIVSVHMTCEINMKRNRKHFLQPFKSLLFRLLVFYAGLYGYLQCITCILYAWSYQNSFWVATHRLRITDKDCLNLAAENVLKYSKQWYHQSPKGYICSFISGRCNETLARLANQ